MLQLLQCIFRVFGISPRGNRNDKFFTAVGLAVIFVYNGVMTSINPDGPFSLLRGVISFLFVKSTFVFLAYNYKYSERCLQFKRDLKGIDKELEVLCNTKFGISPLNQGVSVFFVILLIVPLAYSFILPVGTVTTIWIGYFLECMGLIQQVLLVNQVKYRFSNLNQYLSLPTIGPNSPAVLDQVFRIHSNLHDLVADIDDHYCFNNLLLFIPIFLSWIHNMYNILLVISGGDGSTFYLNQYRVILVTGYFLLLVLVCHSCSQTANRTVLIVHRLLQEDTDPSVWDQVRMFSALASGNPVQLTIGAIFTLDRALVTKTSITALSYLIIAIQLKDVKIFRGDDEGFNHNNISLATD